jgi:hypothetical protein
LYVYLGLSYRACAELGLRADQSIEQAAIKGQAAYTSLMTPCPILIDRF